MSSESALLSRPIGEFASPDPHLHTKIVVFDTFAVLGVLVNIAVLAPAIFLPQIKRRKIWFSLIISWILYSASYLLLLGRQTGRHPPFGLCIFQAAFTTSMDVVCIVASTCFTVDFTLQIKDGKEVKHRLANFLAFFPWMIFVAIFLLAQLVVQHPLMVIRDPSHLFCSVRSRPLYLTNWSIILLSATILFSMEVYIAYLLYRKNFIQSANTSISTFVRLVLFTVISATGIGVHSFIISRANNTVTACSIILTCLPVLSGLMFGTTRDILQAWMFWKKTAPTDDHQYSAYPFALDPRNKYEDSFSFIKS